jgi:hypothetical protein
MNDAYQKLMQAVTEFEKANSNIHVVIEFAKIHDQRCSNTIECAECGEKIIQETEIVCPICEDCVCDECCVDECTHPYCQKEATRNKINQDNESTANEEELKTYLKEFKTYYEELSKKTVEKFKAESKYNECKRLLDAAEMSYMKSEREYDNMLNTVADMKDIYTQSQARYQEIKAHTKVAEVMLKSATESLMEHTKFQIQKSE